jgi:hypothetical protein
VSILLHENEFVSPGSKADFFSVDKLGFPFRFRSGVFEVIMVIMETLFVKMISKY